MPVAPSNHLMSSSSVRPDPHASTSTALDSNTVPGTPQVQVNGMPATDGAPRRTKSSSSSSAAPESDGSGWGANFWVTLVDPQTGVSFYACPATGEVSWDPPVGNFLLPPSPEGEWWEMTDEASGVPYYYHTKTGETVWERPQTFVIPLSVLQNTALGRRLSLRTSQSTSPSGSPTKPSYQRSRSYANDREPSTSSLHPQTQAQIRRRSQSTSRPTTSPNGSTSSKSPSPNPSPHPSPARSGKQVLRRSVSGEKYSPGSSSVSPLAYERGHPLAPIPGSPYATDASPPSSPSKKSALKLDKERDRGMENGKGGLDLHVNGTISSKESPKRSNVPSFETEDGLTRSRSSKSSNSANFIPYRSVQPQSLNAALEMIALSNSQQGSSTLANGNGTGGGGSGNRAAANARQSLSLGRKSGQGFSRLRVSTDPAGAPMNGKRTIQGSASTPASPALPASANLPNFAHVKTASQLGPQATSSPPKTTSALPSSINDPAAGNRQWMVGREISSPVFDREATMNMSPIKMRNAGRPILIDQPSKKSGLSQSTQGESPWDAELGIYTHRKKASLDTGLYPVLPDDLASDIQQFSETQFARQYFSTHRTGFIFRRKVPVEQMMTWQKSPLSSPLLQLNKPLHKEAVKTFKSMQRVMGDRDRDRPIHNGSTTSLLAGNALLEEERSLLGEGLAHGELRDEIYCQVMKQLNGNPNPESVFKGWQLLCVLLVTFPPSKNFEASLRNFLQRATHQPEGRMDIMAKYCLRRLSHISRKGPRGKAPTLSEIESASDAAFHPSIFGESLDAIFRLQERNYPQQKVPIILPFLSDGILALGGTKSEGIFRVPGDGDTVSELKLRIDKGYYTLDGFDDPHVLASLLKLWLRELADPLIPDELYNDCITESSDPEACVMIVHRLPTINRRVVLFVVSFLQLFLEDKVQTITKMTAPNLALVMAPNLLRCSSESMAVVFTNAQYEQTFVHNLLLHLRCDEVDPDYVPVHGHGAIPSPSPPIPLSKSNPSKGRNRSNS